MMKKSTKLQESSNFWDKIKQPKDFIVKEHISPKYLRKYSFTGSKVSKKTAKNVIALLKKTSLTTDEALNFISEKLNISKFDIGFAGLKDKHAVTEQYITIPKNKFKKIKSNNIELTKISETDNKLSPGDLVENEFIITLHTSVKPKEIEFMPNYFGFQRFGSHKDNHIIGKKILLGHCAQYMDKKKKKFLIHAYQSYLFNKMLDQYQKYHKTTVKKVPIIGCNTRLGSDLVSKIYKQMLKKEKIKTSDFDIKDTKMKCIGASRQLFVKPKDFTYKQLKNKIELHFTLPKGSYATVLVMLIHD